MDSLENLGKSKPKTLVKPKIIKFSQVFNTEKVKRQVLGIDAAFSLFFLTLQLPAGHTPKMQS